MWIVLETEEKEEEEEVDEQEEEIKEEETPAQDNLKEGTKCMLNYSLWKRDEIEKEYSSHNSQNFYKFEKKNINTEIEELEGKDHSWVWAKHYMHVRYSQK